MSTIPEGWKELDPGTVMNFDDMFWSGEKWEKVVLVVTYSPELHKTVIRKVKGDPQNIPTESGLYFARDPDQARWMYLVWVYGDAPFLKKTICFFRGFQIVDGEHIHGERAAGFPLSEKLVWGPKVDVPRDIDLTKEEK